MLYDYISLNCSFICVKCAYRNTFKCRIASKIKGTIFDCVIITVATLFKGQYILTTIKSYKLFKFHCMQSYVEIPVRLVNIATYLSNMYEFILIDNKSQKTLCLFMPPVPTL